MSLRSIVWTECRTESAILRRHQFVNLLAQFHQFVLLIGNHPFETRDTSAANLKNRTVIL